MNSLKTKSIRQFVSKYMRHESTRKVVDTAAVNGGHRWPQLNGLNIHLRQEIVDYMTAERANVSPKLIQCLMSGGLLRMDLWRLCQSNPLTTTEVMALLETMAQNSQCFESLSLGGSDWIFNARVVRGPLKRLFETKLQRLASLRMQSVASAEDLLAIFRSCPRLKRLEICLPSVTDREVDRIDARLKCCEAVPHLKELLLPSSFRCRSLMKLLATFGSLKTLKCVPFEQLMDLIDCSLSASHTTSDSDIASKAKTTLSSLTSLTVTQPMSYDAVDRLVAMCPRLKTLCLELQDGMQLSPITRLPDLKHLELRNSPSNSLEFSTQVLPILETSGRQLEALSLEHFDVIDLTTCAKLCPNLQRFSAQWFTTLGYPRPDLPSSRRDPQLKQPFANTTHVRLRPTNQRNIPSDACAFLLAAAKRLTHIELYCCYDLSDGDVQALHSRNPLPRLRSLILRHGHKVTKEALTLLVSRAHGLAFVDCGVPLVKDEATPDP
jgi:hypothetical protein